MNRPYPPSEIDDKELTEGSTDDVDRAEPVGPPPPWSDTLALWGRGEQAAALDQLMAWVERNPYHRQRRVAIRLGQSWARVLKDQKALERLETMTAQEEVRPQRRRSKRAADQQNYMSPSSPKIEPSKSRSF